MKNNEKLLGDGCKTCPVQQCQTMHYRGSTCAAQRAQCGVTEDPFSWGDKIRSETNEYIARQLFNFMVSGMQLMAEIAGIEMPDLYTKVNKEQYLEVVLKQLYSPYEETEKKNE